MKYLLDTNICIYFFKGQYSLNEKFSAIGFNKFAISEITLAELLYGAEKSQNISKNLFVIENFADRIVILPIFDSLRVYAKEKARLKTTGNIISDFDLLIGATAIVNDLTLITRNTRELNRMQNLKIENWID